MNRYSDAKAPRVTHSGPVGGFVMDKLIKSRGLLTDRFHSLREGLWMCDVTDRVTGEPKGRRWITREGMVWAVLREEPAL